MYEFDYNFNLTKNEMSYLDHWVNVKCYPQLSANSTKVRIAVTRQMLTAQSGSVFYRCGVNANGTVLKQKPGVTHKVQDTWGYSYGWRRELFYVETDVNHDASGRGSVTISVDLDVYTDDSIFAVPKKQGTCNVTVELEPIDLTSPAVDDFDVVNSDQFGRGGKIYVKVSHGAYDVTTRITIANLGRAQASYNLPNTTIGMSDIIISRVSRDIANGTATFEAVSKPNSPQYNLDMDYWFGGLATGTDYTVTLVATAENGKSSAVLSKILHVPQRITSFDVPTKIVKMLPNSEYELYLDIKPDNAEDKTIIYSFSNDIGLTADQNGVLHSTSIGDTDVTLITRDGGFVQVITVNVTASNEMPYFDTPIRFLSAEEVTKIRTALTFLADRMTAKGYAAPTYGVYTFLSRRHPICRIRQLLHRLDDDISSLNAALRDDGILDYKLPTEKIYTELGFGDKAYIVNEWIAFLQAANEALK